MSRRVGVCSWSLTPKTPHELVESIKACSLHAVQLALLPLAQGEWKFDETRAALEDARIAVLSGMLSMKGEDYSTLDSIKATGGVRSDKDWPDNLKNARAAAAVASELGLKLVTFHAGFLPHEPGDSLRKTMLDRLRQIAGAFAEKKISVGLETGQESAETLLEVLSDLEAPNVGINFDPANMILYAMGDPVAALERLASRVMQIHIKDAVKTRIPGQWGTEVPAGEGDVNWRKFFAVLNRKCPDCELAIEREAGDSRIADIKAARLLIASVGR